IIEYPKNDVKYSAIVNVDVLSDHIDLDRSKYLPYLQDTLLNPSEVWLSYEQHLGTGVVKLRQRVIKVFDIGDKRLFMLAVFQSEGGCMEAWTVIPTSDVKYINKQRVGQLIYSC
ncbi:MAG: hypothetical protein HQK93_02060, partial [Nitrospirae bacterium]|nr:hypothetical protein [Nitrospirota bacterium]